MQEPLYVRQEDARPIEAEHTSHLQWLVVITVLVTLASWIALMVAHEQHAYHGDQAMTPEYAQCLNDQMDEFIRTGVPADSDQCKPVMLWYAAHPFGYALIVGAVVLVVGRLAIFMYRVERSRGY